jgi:hypothetical protein
VATETVDPTDFQVTLNTGEIVFGHAVGMNRNWENSERNLVGLFGDFGNRKKSSEPGALFPVKLKIVADATPLLLIGPGGQEVNAVGLNWETNQSPYYSSGVMFLLFYPNSYERLNKYPSSRRLASAPGLR